MRRIDTFILGVAVGVAITFVAVVLSLTFWE